MFDDGRVHLQIDEPLIVVNMVLESNGIFWSVAFDPGKKPGSDVGVVMTFKTTDKHETF